MKIDLKIGDKKYQFPLQMFGSEVKPALGEVYLVVSKGQWKFFRYTGTVVASPVWYRMVFEATLPIDVVKYYVLRQHPGSCLTVKNDVAYVVDNQNRRLGSASTASAAWLNAGTLLYEGYKDQCNIQELLNAAK